MDIVGMNKQIDQLIHELQGVKPLLASQNYRRADELLTLIDRQLNGLRQEVWLSFHRSGEGLKK